ncbi:MAG: peptidoglycan DD-metalloendopeptidase family protein [Oscillospiraceae bacterium]|jgi:murein DD-endopeptidase MepM/ murein hydrolase activator NlpD|nr:peptidoglycan DD-metalloendopeptidase family protein [Oscillospiraceae bacterium]
MKYLKKRLFKIFKKFFSALFASSIVLTNSETCVISNPRNVVIENIKQKILEHKKILGTLNKERNENNKKLENQKLDQQKTIKNISEIESKINEINTLIVDSKNKIKINENKIINLEKEISNAIVILRKCLNLFYKAENPNLIEIILKSRNYGDFLDKANAATFVARKIEFIVDQINSNIEEISLKRTENEKLLAENKKRKELLTQKRSEWESESKKIKKNVKETKEEIDKKNALLEKTRSQMDELIRRLEEKENKRKTKKAVASVPVPGTEKSSVGKKIFWPLKKRFRLITSNFFDYKNRGNMHGAIDIAGKGIYGATVSAAAGGEVIESGYLDGYGLTVMIRGKYNRVFIYGHLSGVVVKKWDIVEDLQVIGFVGNTGFSTGPHLHFEMRENGRRVNPSDYLIENT